MIERGITTHLNLSLTKNTLISELKPQTRITIQAPGIENSMDIENPQFLVRSFCQVNDFF